MTLSNLVRRVEYVDCHGRLNVVDDPQHLKVVSGSFGLMGVVTHVTLDFPPMSYALLAPVKMPVVQAVPPPPELTDDRIPSDRLKGVDRSPQQKRKDQAEFEIRATSDYYAEWFWFPLSKAAWVNTWNNVTDPTGVEEFSDSVHLFPSFIQTVLLNIIQTTPLLDTLQNILGSNEAAVALISWSAMQALPDRALKTHLPDALHFQRSIQNIRVRDLEVERPLVAKANKPDEIDFTTVQRAWWDALLTVYEPKHLQTVP